MTADLLPRLRIDPRVCLAFVGMMVLCIATTRGAAWSRMAAEGGATMCAVALARVSRRVIVRSLVPIAFMGIAGCLALPFGSSPAALLSFCVRTGLVVLLVVALRYACPLTDVMAGLRWYRVPRSVTSLVLLATRYVSVLAEETESMGRGYRSRVGQRKLWTRAVDLGCLAETLALRASDRSERIANAMLARGFTGELPTGDLPPLGPSSVMALTAAFLVGAVSVMVAYR